MTYSEHHFKRLNILKFICIFAILAMIALLSTLAIINFIQQQKTMLQDIAHIKFDQIEVMNDSTIAVHGLDIEKTADNNVVYHLLADHATKNTQSIINMQNITLIYDKTNLDNIVTIKAANGLFHENTRRINITSPVEANFQNYKVETSALHIDLTNNTMNSNNHITITHPQYKFEADSFKATQTNKIIKFNGNVKATISILSANNQ